MDEQQDAITRAFERGAILRREERKRSVWIVAFVLVSLIAIAEAIWIWVLVNR
jgi:type IV secretory pathway component VirB8